MPADPPALESTAPATVFLRPLGSPLPLGFIGLLMANGVLSSLDLGWIPVSEQHQVGLVLVAFAFPLQALATVILFLARDAPAGAGIGVLSVTWLTYGLLLSTSPPGRRSATAAIFLFVAAAALLPASASSILNKLVPAAVFGAAALRIVLTGLYEKLGGSAIEHAAGWEGIVVAGMALYAAFASDLEASTHRDVLTLGRRRAGQRAMEQTVSDQARQLETEPGVRSQV
jgi:succinate-acetate transporter protein